MGMYDNKEPYVVEIKARESVWVCSCGKTSKPPFCDGSHQKIDGAAGPEELTADTDSTFYVCGCGKTGKGVFCDGSHSTK